MNREDIIRMAREAGWDDHHAQFDTRFQTFAALVATNDTSQNRVDKTSEIVHEPVQWGVDWGRAGDSPCVSIIKRLPDGRIEVVAVEYGPQRTWVGLTDEEIKQMGLSNYIKVVRETESKLKEKNR